MPEYPGGPCQAALESGGLCGVEMSTCWYGASRKGIHFCAKHRSAWKAFEAAKRNGAAAAAEAEEETVLFEVDSLLGTRYCEPSRMKAKQRRNKVENSTLEFCVQGKFACEVGDERGEIGTRWLAMDELIDAACSREEFKDMYNAYLKALKQTFESDAKRLKTAAQLEADSDS